MVQSCYPDLDLVVVELVQMVQMVQMVQRWSRWIWLWSWSCPPRDPPDDWRSLDLVSRTL